MLSLSVENSAFATTAAIPAGPFPLPAQTPEEVDRVLAVIPEDSDSDDDFDDDWKQSIVTPLVQKLLQHGFSSNELIILLRNERKAVDMSGLLVELHQLSFYYSYSEMHTALQRMTADDFIQQYNREKHERMLRMFDADLRPLFLNKGYTETEIGVIRKKIEEYAQDPGVIVDIPALCNEVRNTSDYIHPTCINTNDNFVTLFRNWSKNCKLPKALAVLSSADYNNAFTFSNTVGQQDSDDARDNFDWQIRHIHPKKTTDELWHVLSRTFAAALPQLVLIGAHGAPNRMMITESGDLTASLRSPLALATLGQLPLHSDILLQSCSTGARRIWGTNMAQFFAQHAPQCRIHAPLYITYGSKLKAQSSGKIEVRWGKREVCSNTLKDISGLTLEPGDAGPQSLCEVLQTRVCQVWNSITHFVRTAQSCSLARFFVYFPLRLSY